MSAAAYRFAPLSDVSCAALAAFIAQREASCVSCAAQLLTQRLLVLENEPRLLCRAAENARQLPSVAYEFAAVVSGGGRELCGVIGVSPAGLVLHCLDVPESVERRRELARLCAGFFSEKKLYCISGERAASRLLEQAAALAANAEPAEIKDFFLMQQSAAASQAFSASQFAAPYVVRCCPEDEALLLPLETAFEQEEVLPRGWQLNPAAVRFKLCRALHTGAVCAVLAEDGEHFAAKAAVTAESGGWIQIGGVYTIPEYRGRRYAAALVRSLSARAEEIGKRAVLYVNEQNSAAVRAYTAAGFAASGRYRICYF
ncbi:MAG TPA: GNAT family N-acetyltransferase [Candidatus Treponema faecavium]|nr:GNAT family N-acetyltransferase [Candidatus Treponema faecavium]